MGSRFANRGECEGAPPSAASTRTRWLANCCAQCVGGGSFRRRKGGPARGASRLLSAQLIRIPNGSVDTPPRATALHTRTGPSPRLLRRVDSLPEGLFRAIMVFSGEQMSALAPHRGRRTAVPRRVDAIAFARGVSARAPAPVDTPTTVFLSRSANKFASVTSSLVHRNQNVVVTGVAASAASSKTKTTTEKKDDAEDELTIKRLMERRPIAVVTHVLGTGKEGPFPPITLRDD